MTRPDYFIWLLWQATSGLLYVWPITLALLLLITFTGFLLSKRHGLTLRAFTWCVTPLTVPILMLVWGTLLKRADDALPLNELAWQTYPVILLLVMIIPVVGLVVWRARQSRWFAAACGVFSVWLTLWTAFVAAMSVSGDWI